RGTTGPSTVRTRRPSWRGSRRSWKRATGRASYDIGSLRAIHGPPLTAAGTPEGPPPAAAGCKRGGRQERPSWPRMTLRGRWLGRVKYQDAHALQRGLFAARNGDDWLLLLEHPHVYTLGVRAKAEHVLVPPASVGADLVKTDRG